jgi:hypothetical protein
MDKDECTQRLLVFRRSDPSDSIAISFRQTIGIEEKTGLYTRSWLAGKVFVAREILRDRETKRGHSSVARAPLTQIPVHLCPSFLARLLPRLIGP